jgi:hypothetical protein
MLCNDDGDYDYDDGDEVADVMSDTHWDIGQWRAYMTPKQPRA